MNNQDSNPGERDVAVGQQVAELIRSPELIRNLSDEEVLAKIEWCLRRLRQLRMGGRSSALPGLAVLLFYAAERWRRMAGQINVTVEELLGLAFRIAFDPSFVMPEWAIVIVGVLLSEYNEHIPPNAKAEVITQCLLLLRDIEISPASTISARQAAAALLEEASHLDEATKERKLRRALNRVIDAAVGGWPATDSVAEMRDDEIGRAIEHLVTSLPSHMTERERRVYRLHLERQGVWDIFSNSQPFVAATTVNSTTEA